MASSSPRKSRAERFGGSVNQHRSPLRNPSAPWSRLRAPILATDPLESIGLPSKGESRLKDEKTQEWYYDQITARVLELYSKYSPTVADSLSKLSLTDSTAPASNPERSPDGDAPFPQKDMDIILLALRKLREATLASAPSPTTQKYLTFSIRTSILFNDPASYAPALQHLLRTHILPVALQREFLGYYILDLACRQHKLADALGILVRCREDGAKQELVERNVREVVLAVVRDQSLAFFRVLVRLDARQRRIAGWAERGLVLGALKAVGKAYMKIDLGVLLRVTGQERWEGLRKEYGVGWDRMGDENIVIRRVKAKADGPG